jgi:outer membrane lipoprotein-sorting protein
MGAALLILMAALSAEPPEFDTFFKEFTAKRAGIQVLEAAIVERTSQYEEITSRNGRVVFGKPRRIVFRYSDVDPVMLIDDRRVYEFDPEEEQLQIYDIEDSPEASIFFLGFDDDPGALREAYDVRLFTVQNDQGSQGIAIKPFKENLENAPFQEVSIYLRDDDFLPFRIHITFDDDTWMVTEFSNYKVNQGLEPSETQIRVPAGTRVIENGEVAIHSVPDGGVLMPPEAIESAKPVAPASETPAPAEKSPGQLEVEDLPAP